MKEGANYLIGEHDFESFCSSKTQVSSTVRTIYSIDISKNSNIIIIKIVGNGFLYNMVRIIVGTLIDIGSNKYLPSYVKDILDAKDRKKAGNTVPAKGLKLVGIDYNN